MDRTFRYRLLPTEKQAIRLLNALDACRHLYNAALEHRILAWKGHRKSIGFAEQSRELPAIMAAIPEFQAAQHHVLQKALRRLDLAFAAFFRSIRDRKRGTRGRRAGFPRFKGRHRYRSLDFDSTAFRLLGDRVRLSKVGDVRLVLHRPIPVGAKVKRTLVTRDAVGDWWVSFQLELPDVPPREPKTALGVDLGLTNLMATSEGDFVEPPKSLAKNLERLRREQRKLSRRKRGGRNREKQRIEVAKVHRRIERQRSDWLHKVSKKLAERADLIVFEDLKVQNMVRNHKLARAILDAGWGELPRMTAYKAASAGGKVVRVGPRNSSQECSACGGIVPKALSERTHRCRCGLVLDRDVNAARVVVKRGLGPYPHVVANLGGAHEPASPTGGTPGSHACGDWTSTAAEAVASPVVEAGRRHPLRAGGGSRRGSRSSGTRGWPSPTGRCGAP